MADRAEPKPLWIQIAGRKNSGKTTLAVSLIQHLVKLNYTVASVKHSSHRHPVDIPGKDSWQHRQAGTIKTALVSQAQAGLFFSLEREEGLKEELSAHFSDADVVVVESGGGRLPVFTIEVWRQAAAELPLALEHSGISALVCSGPVPDGLEIPVFSPTDLEALVDFIITRAGEHE